LFCWIGDADLAAWAGAIGESAEKLLTSLGRKIKAAEGSGPIKTLVDQVAFDTVHLLSDKPAQMSTEFARWIGPSARVHQVKLSSPVDYSDIFTAVDSVLKQVVSSIKGDYTLSIHLSPGTPAMTAVWVLLGKSRYPATFYQTYQSKVIPTNIPFDLLVDFLPAVLHASDRILQSSNLADAGTGSFGAVIGSSPAIREVIARARRIALRDVSVLLLGESGVGKDVFANAIHGASRRSGRPFVAINCAAVPKELLESELFGHKKGSFTGATNDRQGAFELADSGTLFLDEVGECDLSMQAKLLRVLQPNHDDPPATRRFRRIGDSTDQTSDVRIIAATNRDLHAEVAAGRFREDLYYRLAAFTVKIPPLRSRQSDIPIIADHLLEKINTDFSRTEPGYQYKALSVRTKRFLRDQPWPGNVRQLHNALLQAAVMVDGPTIDPGAIQQGLAETAHPSATHPIDPPLSDGFSLDKHLESIQKRFLARAMREAEGKKTVAAKLLGYPNYQTLAAQLERLDVQWEEA
jgi:transcriptional regulator with PAS, ATPase and Fis domain